MCPIWLPNRHFPPKMHIFACSVKNHGLRVQTTKSSYFVLPSSKFCSLFRSSTSLSSRSRSLSASILSFISSRVKSGDLKDLRDDLHLEERLPFPKGYTINEGYQGLSMLPSVKIFSGSGFLCRNKVIIGLESSKYEIFWKRNGWLSVFSVFRL